MTYGQLCKTIKAHRGRVYACVNAEGGQYQFEAKKGEMLATFRDHGLTHGMRRETGLEAKELSGDLYIDTCVED